MWWQIILTIIGSGFFIYLIIWLVILGRKFQILDDLKDSVGKIWDKLEGHTQRLTKLDGMIESHSPRTLAEKGNRLLEQSGLKNAVDNHLDELLNFIKEKQPKSLLDIENQSFSSISDSQDKDWMTPVKDFIYNNPKFENTDLNIDVIIFIGGIYLRDKYLEKYPELIPKETVKI